MKIVRGVDQDVKLCPKCKKAALGMRDILRTFSRNCLRADGLQVYCRECRRRK